MEITIPSSSVWNHRSLPLPSHRDCLQKRSCEVFGEEEYKCCNSSWLIKETPVENLSEPCSPCCWDWISLQKSQVFVCLLPHLCWKAIIFVARGYYSLERNRQPCYQTFWGEKLILGWEARNRRSLMSEYREEETLFSMEIRHHLA